MLTKVRYTSAKRALLSNDIVKLSDGVPVHIAASLAAGTVATTVCAPADVLKSRLQSATSASGEAPVREACRAFAIVLKLKKGSRENIGKFVEERGARVPDERVDTGLAPTSVGRSAHPNDPG